MEEIKNKHFPRGGYVFGIILILLGTLFLLFNFGLLNKSMRSVIFSWQMLLIACAIFAFFSRHFFSGSTMLILGLFFLIPKLVRVCPDIFGWFGDDFTSTYWPTLLIVFGILIIARLFFPKSQKGKIIYTHHFEKKKCNCGCNDCTCNSNFERNVIFGSIEEIILDPVFNGGEINTVFGSLVLDLRKTTLPEGDTELEVNSVFGAATLYIPNNWNVELQVSSLASGFRDNRNISDEIDYSQKLIITGGFVFAGGEIRS
ncbi:MAG: cell wall-active antibiotics response protein [Prevotellaceae bacterium]|nr:cell wall-active antibiotics response protein [Prevotellaceae bacterium]